MFENVEVPPSKIKPLSCAFNVHSQLKIDFQAVVIYFAEIFSGSSLIFLK